MAKGPRRTSTLPTSGRPLSSGSPSASGSPIHFGAGVLSGVEQWGAFAIGQGLGKPSASTFLLAPRLYVLSELSSEQRTAANMNGGGQALGELPRHLIFQELPLVDPAKTRQTWISEKD